jgi:hypothetical protein
LLTRLIVSLFDFSGEWSRPYREAGYRVIQVDLKLGDDVRLMEYIAEPVYGVLLAPPCTDFAGSGAQYWPAKDANGATAESLALVDAGLRIVALHRPKFWVLENPVGRLNRWLGPPRFIFNPCDYGDAYTKKTCLWGDFNSPFKANRVEPVFVTAGNGDRYAPMMMATGGKSERTKELRSATPPGFSQAFFEANQ